jgi:hypothetical protein
MTLLQKDGILSKTSFGDFSQKFYFSTSTTSTVPLLLVVLFPRVLQRSQRFGPIEAT